MQVYAPNLESEYAAFLEEVDAALDRVAEMDSYILMGDFNAHVGVDVTTWESVIGRNGDPHQNANGERLLDFCCANGMSIMNTFFPHKDVHKYTWYRQSLQQKSLIDFFVVPSCAKRMVCDVRVLRGAELSTDHHLVLCTLYLADKVPLLPRRKPRVVTRIRWEKLQSSEVRQHFARHISERFEQIPTVPSHVEEEWRLFSTAVISAARDICGVKRLGVAAGGEKRTAWFKTPGVQEAIRGKKKTYRDWILLGDSASRDRYTEARRTCKLAVRAAKEQSWKEFGEKLESDHRSAKKVFWQTIRRLRGRKFNIIEGVKSKDGVLLSNETDILRRWSEHFSELLNPEQGTEGDRPVVLSGAENSPTVEEVILAIESLKVGKSAGVDEIRPEMLKAMGKEGVLWLSRVIKVAWERGETPADWQTGVIVPLFKKGDKRDCSNYRGISLLSLPGKVYAKVLETRSRAMVESQIGDEQCGFRHGRSTTDQLFTLRMVLEKAWEYAKPVYSCFVDLEKAYDRVPRGKLWSVLQEYGIDGSLMRAIQSLYTNCSSCVRVNGSKSTPFTVGVGLRQGCVLSPLLFILYMDWMLQRSQGEECFTLGELRISHLLFADDLVILTSSQTELQCALDRFVAVCANAGMKVNVDKSEVMVVSRTPVQCTLHVSGVPLKQVEKFKYLGVFFTSDGRSNTELSCRIGQAGSILKQLGRSVIRKTELGVKTKLAVFNSVFVPTLTYGHEIWVMTERIRSRIQAAEMRFLRAVVGVTRRDRVRNTAVREELNVEQLLLRTERAMLQWFGHVARMSPRLRLPRRALNAIPSGKRPLGRPRMRWLDQVQKLAWLRLGIAPDELELVAEDRVAWRSQVRALPPRPL